MEENKMKNIERELLARTDKLNEVIKENQDMKKIIELMAIQLVGLPIVGDELGEILIPQTEAEVIDYYKGKIV